MSQMIWPDRPLCHDDDPQAQQYAGLDIDVGWRDPKRTEAMPYAPTYRTCWFCGSIHPEDLWHLLTDGTPIEVHRADRKYGWPHKFYVDGIPNPIAGDMAETGFRSMGVRPRLDELDQEYNRNPQGREATDDELFAAGWKIRTVVTSELEWDGEDEREVRHHEQVSFRLPLRAPAPSTMQAKWYNNHLLDLLRTNESTFKRFAQVLFDRTGVLFTADEDGRLLWRG